MDGEVAVSVQLDSRWVELPVRGGGEPGEWAARAVDELLRARDRALPRQERVVHEQTWAALLESLRARVDGGDVQLGAAYALLSDEDLLPVVVAEMAAVALTTSIDGLVDSLVLPAERRFGEPAVETVATAAGDAVRLEQMVVVHRFDEAGADEDPAVETSRFWVWPGPVEGTALVLSAWFSSPVDAELSGPLLDELAASVRVGG